MRIISLVSLLILFKCIQVDSFPEKLISSDYTLQIILVVCDENLEWLPNVAKVRSSLLVYTKCSDLKETQLENLKKLGATVRRGPRSSGYSTKSLHTYVSDMIERKKSLGSKNTSYLYIRPSLLFAFDEIKRNGKVQLFEHNVEKQKLKIESFFASLKKLSESERVLAKIGFLEFGDTRSRSFNCIDFTQRRFPQNVAKQWKIDGLPCIFRGFPRNQFLISASYLDRVSLPLLFEILKALDESHKKKRTRKIGRNYFARKLEQFWDGLMGCPLEGGMNYCDNCGNLGKTGGYGLEKVATILEDIEDENISCLSAI